MKKERMILRKKPKISFRYGYTASHACLLLFRLNSHLPGWTLKTPHSGGRCRHWTITQLQRKTQGETRKSQLFYGTLTSKYPTTVQAPFFDNPYMKNWACKTRFLKQHRDQLSTTLSERDLVCQNLCIITILPNEIRFHWFKKDPAPLHPPSVATPGWNFCCANTACSANTRYYPA